MPLLKVLSESPEGLHPSEAANKLASYFPEITRKDLSVTLPKGHNRWLNRVEWTKQTLTDNREVDTPTRGLWRITPKGLNRLRVEWKSPQRTMGPGTIHDKVVRILYGLAKRHTPYKEVWADQIGVPFKPLLAIGPYVKGVRPDVQPYNPDIWAKLRNNTFDVYEVWDSQGEKERRSDCVEDVLLPALTENVGTLSIVCFDQETAEFARKLVRIILPSVTDGQGAARLDLSSVLPYVVVVPQNIQKSTAKIELFLRQKLDFS